MNPLEGLITPVQLADFCERWKIVELIAYESPRYANTPENEIQLMMVQKPEAQEGLLQLVQMMDELSDLTGKSIVLVDKEHIETSHYWDRLRERVFKSAQVIYVGR